MAEDRTKNNVVDFNKDRKPTIKNDSKTRVGASSGKFNGKDAGYDRALKAQKGRSGSPISTVRWFHYVQVILLLGLVAWVMKACQF